MKIKFNKKDIGRVLSALLLIFPGLAKLEVLNEFLPYLVSLNSSFNSSSLESAGESFGLGLFEIIAGSMFFYKKLAAVAAVIGTFFFSGGVLAHFNKLGFHEEMGILFALTLLGLVCSLTVLLNFKKDIPVIGRFL